MRDAIRHFVSEFVGTFALVFFAGGAVMSGALRSGGLLDEAVAHGVIIAVLVTATMRISGHINPAVTLGFLVTRRIEPMMAGIYIVGQFTAALLAAYALSWLFPAEVAEVTRLGGQRVALDVTMSQAIALEALGTFFLMFVIFGTAVDPQSPRVGGFAIGLTAAVNTLAIGALTGASLNPARSFGPAVASGIYEGQVVYWVGPILGAIIAALLYDTLFLPRRAEPVAHGAVAP